MLQDLEKGKPTEVRMINGYVCETGDKYGIDTPFNDKVVEIVTKIERGELPLSMDNVKLFDRTQARSQVQSLGRIAWWPAEVLSASVESAPSFVPLEQENPTCSQ